MGWNPIERDDTMSNKVNGALRGDMRNSCLWYVEQFMLVTFQWSESGIWDFVLGSPPATLQERIFGHK